MEKQNKETVKIVKKSSIFKLIIPEEVEKKIRYTCQHIWRNEWSGILFYESEGRFEDNTLTIRCVDIYIMDIGTTASTEFDMSPEVVNYIAAYPKLLDCQMGLIHSHNLMNSFFSSVDIATLKEEGMERNHFVSLIVNNEGTYTAAITRKVKTISNITKKLSYSTFENKEETNEELYTVEEEILEWFNLEIEFEESDSFFKEELSTRLKEIKQVKAENSNPLSYNKPLYSVKYENNKLPQQGILFPEIDKRREHSFDVDYIENNISKEIPYEDIEPDEKTIKSLILQLLTGSVIIPNESKIDISKWVQNMVPLYERRFGKDEEGMKLFRAWAEGYVEFLCLYNKDNPQGILDDAFVTMCAYSIIEELTKLPENKYIKEYIDILKSYLYE